MTLVEDRGPLRTLFLPNFHGAALVMGLALLLIALRAYQAQTWQWSARLLFVLIGVLTCFSDLIIAPQTLAPLCVAVLAAWCAGTASTRFSVQSLVLIVATTALGVFMAKHPPHLFIPAPAPPRFAYDRLGEGLRLFLNSDHANGHVVMLLGAVVSITLAIAALFRSWRADDPSDAAARAPLVIAVAYLISSIAASLLTGTATWVDEWSSRYFYLVYVLPVLLSPIWLCCLLRRHASTVNAVWVVLAVLMGGFNIAATLKRSTQEHLAMPYPQWLACLDDIAEQRHIQFGYGDYWDAKYASVLSHRGLIVNQLTPSYERYYWINNVDWYPNKIDGSFFLLPDHLPDPEPRLGHPTATLRCADRQVFIYDGASAAKLPRTGSGPR